MDDDKKHTPEENTLSKTNISGMNVLLPWKWCTVHDSRRSQLRQAILIFMDSMITGVLSIISPLQVFHQLSLIISHDKHSTCDISNATWSYLQCLRTGKPLSLLPGQNSKSPFCLAHQRSLCLSVGIVLLAKCG